MNKIGVLSNGEAVYQSDLGEYSVEKEFRYRVEPNEEELEEISRILLCIQRVKYPSGNE